MIHQLCLLFVLLPHPATLQSDTSYGRAVSKTTVRGQFFTFDKKRDDRFVFDATGYTRLLLQYGEPEMACFVANHDKDELRLSYTAYERPDSTGKTERIFVADRMVSLKSGDDSSTWPQKDVADSAAHHVKLAKLRKEMLGKN